MKAIYVVGPSGAGKSALCKKLAELDSRYIHISLDDEVKGRSGVQCLDEIIQLENGWEKFWEYCSQTLKDISSTDSDDRIYLVDVGAGALVTPLGRQYFKERAKNLISIIGTADVIYIRNQEKLARKGKTRPKDEFLRAEYSDIRQDIYNAAQIKIDTSEADIAASLLELEKAIVSLMQN